MVLIVGKFLITIFFPWLDLNLIWLNLFYWHVYAIDNYMSWLSLIEILLNFFGKFMCVTWFYVVKGWKYKFKRGHHCPPWLIYIEIDTYSLKSLNFWLLIGFRNRAKSWLSKFNIDLFHVLLISNSKFHVMNNN